MCGIVALFGLKGIITESQLKRAVGSLKHRGPDGQSIWIADNFRVGLGHTRLSIIDLNSGDQPIANRNGSLRIIANGEFYDFERIQQELKQWGYWLQTKSDSEIALHLYDRFGTQCLSHLRGEFAFVLWDERNQVLFAARDRFGIKPLYYTVYQGTLYLASEVKALLAAGVPAVWDWESFYLLDSGVLPPHNTLFSSIYQVPPGYFMLASDSGIQLHRYWDFDYPQIETKKHQISAQEYVEELRDILDEAIRLRLRADVPVGCYLSGGLDSSAILGIASRYATQPIQAFTLSFDRTEYNEEAIAAETAQHAGANLQVVPICQSDLAENFADAVCQGEMLCYNAHTTAKYILSRAARNAGYKVVLTGEGADEILGGYIHFCVDMLRHGTQDLEESRRQELLEVLKQKNKISPGQFGAVETEDLESVFKSLGFTPAWMERRVRLKSVPVYSSAFRDRFNKRDAYRLFLNHIDVAGQLHQREPVNQSLYLWSKTHLPNYILRMLGDGVEMAHSLEGRLPFLDHRVVEFICRIPISLKINGFTEKYILREATRPFITETIYSRQKHPFLVPPSSFQPQKPLHQFMQDTLRSSAMAAVPFYDHKAVIQLLDQLPKMSESQQATMDVTLMKMLSSCCLQQRFGL
ncbi:asparagine synthase (glutamine-hydrolyzing) [Planktothrix agardhii]|uniref:asparagine synthase (glutamine-hydrolyzing) n=1 Tax=Planktothrix agardhii TaxID=1160 RepID=UPI002B1F861B|nr:asparagine synthase (glutamine-hydrolyzing) [Planktothrix agardhii]MEA5563550.1 asparagine synthase (glutamine-hydrolyzing) [Planktothrix agardhii UHCC 0887]